MAKQVKRVSPDILETMTWQDIIDLRAKGFPMQNMHKRRNRLYRERFKRRFNALLRAAKLLGMEEHTPYMY